MWTLFLWTVVGFAGAGTQYSREYKKELDWRPLAEVATQEDCQRVARELALPAERFRCVKTK